MSEQLNNDLKYEEVVKRLQEIIKLLENENTSLDDLVELYREGSTLAVKCNKMLEDAQQKITVINQENESD